MASKADTARLDDVRAEIARLQEQHADLENKPRSRDEAVAALDAWIADQAARFDREILRTGSLLEGVAEARLTRTQVGTDANDPTPALCAIAPEGIRRKYVEAIDAALSGREALSAADLEAKQREIKERVHTLEIEEEQLVERLQTGGHAVTRRPDADPAVVLGLPSAPPRPEPVAREE